eukprot:TRINITY_DN3719_c0_g1_i6.p1 TRINITY_DN3719_c0_g1~~TRINITY_DN3719_c0_g1_i6.p1  ORF type:complete len:578 (+),score=136.71 TRINITY_DN3719_c0_g1_i6:50-1783(+)
MSEAVNALELLREEMESDDIALRINAMHRLRIVATVIGVDATRSQLLPLIEGLIKREDDEVLFAIAEELGKLAPMLGTGVGVLLPFLENLASVEETVVRDAAVRSLLSIFPQLSDAELVNNCATMILRLASGEWFTSRVSAVNLIPAVYARAGSQKPALKAKFIELCSEETPMVRRAVAIKIGELAAVVERDVLHELVTIFKQLTGDEQDSVKMLCLESLKGIAKILTKEENKTHILPIIIAATEDKSWRVRQALSRNFAAIAEGLGKEITDFHLIQNFSVVLRDAEVDVRTVAVQSLAQLLPLRLLSSDKLLSLIQHIQALARDPNASVKTGICAVLSIFVSLIGKEVALPKLYPHLLDLLEDDDSEVKIQAYRTVPKFSAVLGQDALAPFLPHAKTAVTMSPRWRVRIAAVDTVIDIGLQYGSAEVFSKHLEPVFLGSIFDRVSQVRESVVARLPELINTLKIEWLSAVLLPKLIDNMTKETTYLFKITAIHAFQAISQVTPPEYNAEKLLPHLAKLGKDSVPNVRFGVVKALRTLAKRLNESVVTSSVKPVLIELSNDPDRDVQFYASDALATL